MTENIKLQIVNQTAIRTKKYRKKGDKRKVFMQSQDRDGKHNRICKGNIDTEEKRNLVSGGGRTQSRTPQLCKNDTTSFAQRASETRTCVGHIAFVPGRAVRNVCCGYTMFCLTQYIETLLHFNTNTFYYWQLTDFYIFQTNSNVILYLYYLA